LKCASILLIICAFSLSLGNSARADTTSYAGSLSSASDIYTATFNISGPTPEAVVIQTWGFGGGTNAAGQSIAAGGFDPFVGLFSGTGTSASILTDTSGNPLGTSDLLSNFASYAGCPPANTVNIGGGVCGDITMSAQLGPGTYTVLLSDAGYIPNAVFDNGTLGEGFSDFTGGAFQTCNTTSSDTTCATDSSQWAFDLTVGGSPTPTPEPSSAFLLGLGIAGLWLLLRGGISGTSGIR